jgi:CBS domain-containing protein
MTIAAILQRKGGDVIAVNPDATVGEAIAILADRGIGAVPVIDGDALVGIFSERDVIHHLKAGDLGGMDAPVSAVMTTPVTTVGREDAVLAALALMTHQRVRHLPVVAGGAVIGVVSIGDLVKHRIDAIEADAAAMREYIQQA